ncbi:uncharacterized protein LOC110467029 [Mizuhopecten yessoensis]|uniref:uncharacterized protein LOC110467029 n=1 Tax=Mizuhopecten yessoensis TaxID=6573 RepID=UPI000B458F92|nr:uncharacterized protein LOC110467029 [Mizuhopecten yessoensis]
MADDSKPLMRTQQTTATEANAVFHDKYQGPRARALQIVFVILVAIMVLVCVILSIYRGIVVGEDGGLYFMLGVSLVGFVVLEIILIIFIRQGELPKEKTWFLYFLGMCVFLEAIFTDILLYN